MIKRIFQKTKLFYFFFLLLLVVWVPMSYAQQPAQSSQGVLGVLGSGLLFWYFISFGPSMAKPLCIKFPGAL